MLKVKDATKSTMSGILWREIRNFIVQTKGKKKLEQLLAVGTPALRKYMHRHIMATTNSPGALLQDFYNAWKIAWPDPAGNEITGMLRWIAKRNLRTIMTIFLIDSTPHVMTMNFPKIWENFFNYGQLNIIEDIGKRVVFEVTGTEAYGEAVCKGTIGWTWQAIEEVGGKNVKVSHEECKFHDHHHCIFTIEWD